MIRRNWLEMTEGLKKAARPARVVVAAADDESSLEALSRAVSENLVSPTLVGDAGRIEELCARLSVEAGQIIDEPDAEKAADLAVRLVRDGAGDFLMKGRLETSQFLRAAVKKENRLRSGGLMCHAAFLEIPAYHKMLAVADGGMIPHPDLEQKKEICRLVVAMLRRLGYEKPKVSVLAGTEKVNDKMPETLDAAELKKMSQAGLFGDCLLDGPISLDLALNEEKAAIKGY
ncbi:MAG: phosphate butyryltransferase, partial [Deltaproteobacteria bacterium]|nr:phosphate butyryltransferase [Deltaproteobacteria bacterium]